MPIVAWGGPRAVLPERREQKSQWWALRFLDWFYSHTSSGRPAVPATRVYGSFVFVGAMISGVVDVLESDLAGRKTGMVVLQKNINLSLGLHVVYKSSRFAITAERLGREGWG